MLIQLIVNFLTHSGGWEPCYFPRRKEDTLIQQIAAKKAELDRLRPVAPRGHDNLNRSYDIELTYTSNAIEGNTQTAAETRMVIEHGITIGGKPLKDHLEAVDHFEALRYVCDLAGQRLPLRETDIRNLHRLVMQRSAPDMAVAMPLEAATSRPITAGITVERDLNPHPHRRGPQPGAEARVAYGPALETDGGAEDRSTAAGAGRYARRTRAHLRRGKEHDFTV